MQNIIPAKMRQKETCFHPVFQYIYSVIGLNYALSLPLLEDSLLLYF